MKKFLVEYANLIGTTVLGLIFGLAFFLLFLNFYHYKEIRTTYTPSQENGTDYENLMKETAVIKQNTNTYNQLTYHGQEDSLFMSNIQAKLNFCINVYESEELKNLLSKETYSISDVYELINYYQDKIQNDCIVLQMYGLGASDSDTIKSERLKVIAPFLKVEMDQQLSSGLGYLKNNIKNNDIYYFSSDDSKINVFELTKNSYLEIMSHYRQTLTFLSNFSEWYKQVAQG